MVKRPLRDASIRARPSVDADSPARVELRVALGLARGVALLAVVAERPGALLLAGALPLVRNTLVRGADDAAAVAQFRQREPLSGLVALLLAFPLVAAHTAEELSA